MDKTTRNSIQRATQAARKLLEGDYREQLEGTFDILVDGTIAPHPGTHLSAAQRVAREKLVAAIHHKRSSGMQPREAVDAYLREAAFTTLNRFVALKMLEARDLVQECVSKGEDSAGFKEFTALAPGLVSLDDKGYRLYLESLFDEIGQEVKVLFDRHDVASLLWPARQSLVGLLGILNAAELSGVWAEDETIGWVYQYFNGDDERTQMRAESQAPRNSRELAVRNQFFTPRYVVQFLTDNTLGRTWYEMMHGDTKLAQLTYLVRRPNEVFLAKGETAPTSDADHSDLSQAERLQQTLHVPFRTKKDPRDLRILDPACGSGHFLLYTFDLLVTIYEEAWADAGAPPFSETDTWLRADYESVQDLRQAMPELILRHNLHGVDIDPRAAQIAALALWMRAQRAYNQFAVDRAQRSPITKTNIVVAEPMPGDTELIDEFAAQLNPAVLGDLFKKMVEEMKLAGELGSLLRVEATLADTVRSAARANEQGNLFDGPGASRDFWARADDRIVGALRDFAESTVGAGGVRRRLFAGDALQGVAFVELKRRQFDVVLMNPPFGYATDAASNYVTSSRVTDIDALFVEVGVENLVPGGVLGAIVNRTQLFKPALEGFRERALLENGGIETCVDLGAGVLDALVETAAFTVRRRESNAPESFSLWGNALGRRDKRQGIVEVVRLERLSVRLLRASLFRKLPACRFAHWVHPDLLELLVTETPLVEDQHVAFGLSTTDNFRFLRLRWEIPPSAIVSFHGAHTDGWVPLAKGGEYSPFIGDIHLLVDWRGGGAALRAMPGAPLRNEHLYGIGGITYSKRTASAFSPRVLPKGCIPEVNGPVILPRNESSTRSVSLLGILVGRVPSYVTDMLVAAGDTSVAGSAAKDYIPGVIGNIPIPKEVPVEVDALVTRVVERLAAIESCVETSAIFEAPLSMRFKTAGQHRVAEAKGWLFSTLAGLLDTTAKIDELAEGHAYKLSSEAVDELDRVIGPIPGSAPSGSVLDDLALADMLEISTEALVNIALERGWSRKDISKNAYRIDRRLELISTLGGLDHHVVATAMAERDTDNAEYLAQEISFIVGCVFGRWDRQALRATVWEDGRWPHPSAVSFSRPPSLATDTERQHAVLVDDIGNDQDLVRAGFKLLREVFGADHTEDEEALRTWIRKDFFSYHVDLYSKSRRKAPIYWQLATASCSYSVWCHYHLLNRDTFFGIANDYVAPKLEHEERKLNELRQQAGPSPAGNALRRVDAQGKFVDELRSFLMEVQRIAPLWNPDPNDGVVINFAPLWRLVPHSKSWQKECKKVWDQLVKGDYDWAHLAMHLWPERVVPKCAKDRSFAIAHGLEEEFWYEDDNGKWKPRKVERQRVDELVEERSSTAVKAALESLLTAPAASGASKRRGRKRGGA